MNKFVSLVSRSLRGKNWYYMHQYVPMAFNFRRKYGKMCPNFHYHFCIYKSFSLADFVFHRYIKVILGHFISRIFGGSLHKKALSMRI